MIIESRTEVIMSEYSKMCEIYTGFTETVHKLLDELLKESKMRVHSINSRVKEETKVREKIDKGGKNYKSLGDITDIAGVRVITYFEDGVDIVAKIIEREFDIDMANSIDKRTLLDPDRFGYLSLHYVCKLSKERLRLTEYKRFAGCKVEIQIRSILQHAWAEIEHDLGYKSKQAIPRDLQRSFSRLAGLLEIADSEFKRIRDSLTLYEKQLPSQLSLDSSSVLIDQISVRYFVENSTVARQIDQEIAKGVGARLKSAKDYIEGQAKALISIGLTTISEVESGLKTYQKQITEWAVKWLASEREPVSRGVCLFYLCYCLVASRDSVKEIEEYLRKNSIGGPEPLEETAKEILGAYRKVKSR